ncbi:unnamed protein product, partial [Meganyctiphanes norvegica]
MHFCPMDFHFWPRIMDGVLSLTINLLVVCGVLTILPTTICCRDHSVDSASFLESWSAITLNLQGRTDDAQIGLTATLNQGAQESALGGGDTSFAPVRGENGRVVMATKAKILFCDLHLMPGESRSFLYKETTLCDAPPTYRGQLVKYAYKITIGTQKLGAPTKLLRVPLRVIVLQGLSDACVYSESSELAPSNPFLHTTQRDTPRSTALQIIQNISTRKNVNQYNITNSRGKVVRFCIYKTSYRLGEDVVATFDFTNTQVPCVQYSVTLQSCEVINESHRQRPNQKSALVDYSKAHEVCLNLSHTNLLIPIPLYITPTFSTDIVSLEWRLHFEFVTSVNDIDGPSTPKTPDEQIEWRAPDSLDIETMVWDLPITVLPTTPNQMAQALCMPQFHTLTL